MTFDDFKQLCDQVKTSGTPLEVPCPIVVGDGGFHAAIGDAYAHHLVVFKTETNTAALQSIYGAVRFSFNAINNQTVIQPITHEA